MAILFAKTKQGMVEGKPAWNRKITVFKGIPFAEPPVGENRWKEPMPPHKWSGVRKCDDYGPIPMQNHQVQSFDVTVSGIPTFGHAISEDCLYLNIWTPAESEDEHLPVVVFIHGGGFHCDYAFQNKHDGEAYAKRGCIFVSVSYRLGIFGFFAQRQLAEEGKGTGNYGLMDQLQALRWIKENISAFGGDPDCVTVMGFSGGAASVEYLCASPLADGLFQRAIMQSGGGFRPVFSSWTVSSDNAIALGNAYMQYMGFQSIREARAASAETLLRGFAGINQIALFDGEEIGVDGVNFLRFTPSVDGYVLPEDPISAFLKGKHPDIDYLVGETNGEGNRTVIADLAWCINQNSLKRRPTYQYYFTRVPPGAGMAFHSSDQDYVFHTLSKSFEWDYNGLDYELSNTMIDYFSNFIKTGDPNGDGLGKWTPYEKESPKAMEFGEERGMMEIPQTEAMKAAVEDLLRNRIPYGLGNV